jgi:drug/metabolite transporter (DMT)-like permease
MADTPVVLGLVLLAALLHAVWNALIKASDDPWLTTLVVFVSGSVACSLGLPFVEPPARESWSYLAAGALLHNIYVTFLVLSYRFGDLSHVYPIARGTGPLLVAALSARVVGEPLSQMEMAGTALISVGILSLAVDRSLGTASGRRAAFFALGTGVWIAGYTLVDAMGIRRAGDPGPLSYVLWLQALEAVPFVVVTVVLRRRDLPAFVRRPAARRGIAGGLMATLGYSMVLWAYSLGAIAPIAALRETGTILAALIGTLVLGEPFGRRRVFAAGLVALGVVVLNL